MLYSDFMKVLSVVVFRTQNNNSWCAYLNEKSVLTASINFFTFLLEIVTEFIQRLPR